MSRIALPNLRIGGLRQFSFGDVIYDRANLYPNLDLDFATNKNLTDNKSGKTSIVSFSRSAASSPGTYVDSQGLIKKSAANLLLQSENLSTSPWTVSAGGGAGVIQNQTLAPDGKQTADLLDVDRITQPVLSLNGTYTFSVYLKAGNNSVPFLLAYNATTASSIFAVDFNLSSGTSSVRTGTGTHSIEDVGDGWYRCQITITVTSTSNVVFYIYNRPIFTGGFYVYAWGAQVEETDPALMGPSAYIKTTSQSLCAPRFDHEPTSGNITTNLLKYSEFEASWNTGNVTKTSQASTDPFGGNNATEIEATAAGLAQFFQSYTAGISGETYTFSAYAKASSSNFLRMGIYDSSVGWANLSDIDLSNGTSPDGATITDVGSGWYRIEISGTLAASGAVAYFYVTSNIIGSAATGGESVYIFGAQLEASSSAGTYVRTLGETRSISDATAESLGLLVEEQRTNLSLYSEDFSNWGTITDLTVTSNAEIAPNGTADADLVVPTAGVSNKRVAFSLTTSNDNVFSFYVKSAGWQYVGSNATNTNGGPVFDILNGAVVNSGPSTRQGEIQDAGNGWYRCIVRYVSNASNNYNIVFLDSGSNFFQGTTATGDGTSGAYFFGKMVENGSFVTSYIPTTTSTQTRYADIAAIQDEDFSVTNLLPYSESFDVDWVPADVTIQANAAQSPDGQTTADLVYPTSTGSARYIRQDGAATSTSTRLSLSVYAKASGKDKLFLYMVSSGTHGVAYFDLADQSTSVVAGGSSTPTATIQDVGDGWYRCTYIIGTSITMLPAYFSGFGPVDAKGSLSVTANGTDGVLFWGAQITATSYPVDYVSTRNLLTDSQDFERSAWPKYRATIDNNLSLAPDKTLTADKLVETTDTNSHLLQRPVTLINDRHTLSFFAKAVERNIVQVRWTGATVRYAEFDLIAETVTWRTAQGTASASIIDVGDGWKKITFSEDMGSGINYLSLFLCNIANNITYTGDGSSGVLLWGAQLEPGTTATEYYRTYDVVGKNYNWYEPTEGTVFVEAGVSPQAYGGQLWFNNNTVGGRGWSIVNGTTTSQQAYYRADDALLKNLSLGTVTQGSINKVVSAIDADDVLGVRNGGTIQSAALTDYYIFNQLRIGHQYTAGDNKTLNSHIKRIIYFPRRTKDSNLILMTE